MKIIRNPSVLAAMAGVTNGEFARHCLIEGGAGMVTIGGYSIGKEMIISSIKAAQRGRKEFILQVGNEVLDILKEAEVIPSLSQLIINLRLNNSNDSKNFAKRLYDLLEGRPLVEINAHCRQPEIIQKGGGQSLLKRLDVLEGIIKNFYEYDFITSLKIRSNAIQSDILIPRVNQWPLRFLHIDAYQEGKKGTDLEAIKKYARKIDIPIIGNNSIVDVESARAIMECGTKFFSIARAANKDYHIFRRILKLF